MNTWFDEHCELFVRPTFGKIPSYSALTKAEQDYLKPYKETWHKARILHLYACWQLAKRKSEGLPILLAGRDPWAFQILAGMEGVPTTFRPEISTFVSQHLKKKEQTAEFANYYMVDTGYKGTVAINLGVKKWNLVKCRTDASKELIADLKIKDPNVKVEIHTLASSMECLPKYWYAGDVSPNGKIIQALAESWSFNVAFFMTKHLHDSLEKKVRQSRYKRYPRKYPYTITSIGRYL